MSSTQPIAESSEPSSMVTDHDLAQEADEQLILDNSQTSPKAQNIAETAKRKPLVSVTSVNDLEVRKI